MGTFFRLRALTSGERGHITPIIKFTNKYKNLRALIVEIWKRMTPRFSMSSSSILRRR